MDVDQAEWVVAHEFGSQNTHETCEHQQARSKHIDSLLQGAFKSRTIVIAAMIDDKRTNTGFSGTFETVCVRVITDDSTDPDG